MTRDIENASLRIDEIGALAALLSDASGLQAFIRLGSDEQVAIFGLFENLARVTSDAIAQSEVLSHA